MSKQPNHNLRLCRQLMFFLLLILPFCAYSQTNLIQGTVFDNNGKPIKGVIVKTNANSGNFITGANGQFSIAGDENSVLLFSHPDFYNYEIRYKKQPTFIVQLFNRYLFNPSGKTISSDTIAGTETPKMVDVLHGQKPVGNIVQSIATVNTNQLTTTPAAQFLQAIPGRLAGLNIVFSSGGPGLDGAGVSTYSIRGARSNATILIDGVERGYTSLDPEQIESVSVLKDALSTVMYGQRSSNGIILITTKKGDKGAPRISFNAQYGVTTPSALPKPLPAWQYATLYNEAQQNDAGTTVITPTYSDADIAAYKNYTDPYGHPDVDWYNTALNKNATVSKYNFSVQGSGNGFRYFVDADYYQEQGLLKTSSVNSYNTNSQLDRYLLRSNVGADVTTTTSIQLNLFGRFQRYNQPGGGIGGILTALQNTRRNAYPVFNPNGSLAGTSSYGGDVNIWGQTVSRGYQFTDGKDMAVDLQVSQKLDFVLPGLYLKAQGSYNNTTYYATTRAKDFAVFQYNATTSTYTQYGSTTEQSTSGTPGDRYRTTYLEASLGYDKSFGKNNVSAVVLANQQSKLFFTGASTGKLPEKYTDYSARLSYNYDNRYIAEAAGSYSGYNWYAPAKRWTNFWAAGLGWNIHNEGFVKENLKLISNLKLRGTYGMTGSGYLSNAGSYIQSWSNKDNYTASYDPAYFWGDGMSLDRGTFPNALPNPELGPEKAKKLNLGLDLGLWSNRLTFTGEYFYNKYFDLVGTPTYTTALLGTSYPAENYQKFDYCGTDLSVTWQDHIRNFNYFITANLSLVQSKVVYNAELPKIYDYQRVTGRQVGLQYGYIATGLFKSYDEINDPNTAVLASAPKSSLRPGDIRYMDRNNDGVIDDKDNGAIGSGKPTIYYGVTIGFNYKGFDFSALVQGTQNRQSYISGDFMNGFGNNGTYTAYEYNLGRFTTATAATATQPRVWLGSNTNNTQTSTFWIKNNDFVRLKNVELGYTLPTRISRKVGIPSVRIFTNGLNLLTFADIYKVRKDVDPEGWGSSYPIMKVVNFGVNVKF
ncbi:MAG: SusC/RagA family TonB-linked outer membrane protein [Bacteroidota bacterium]|nr:SusC/RagA family TonB-linked outer membrane protein [Bacteroidota bacterium]